MIAIRVRMLHAPCSEPGGEQQCVGVGMCTWEVEQKCMCCLCAPIKENVCEFSCVYVQHVMGELKKK